MKVPVTQLVSIFEGTEYAEVRGIAFDGKHWVVEGSLEGYDFSLPMRKDKALEMLAKMATLNGAEPARRPKRSTSPAPKPVAKPAAPAKQPASPTPVAEVAKAFVVPTAPVPYTRTRMTSGEKAVFTRFKSMQPLMAARRNPYELRLVEIAKSYLLSDQIDVVLKWMKTFPKK